MKRNLMMAVCAVAAMALTTSAWAAKHVAAGAAAAPAAGAVVGAAAGGAAAELTVKGTVKVTKEAGKVTAISIDGADGSYSVKLEGKGLSLQTMDGKTVEAKGTVAEENLNKILTVKTCHTVIERPARKTGSHGKTK